MWWLADYWEFQPIAFFTIYGDFKDTNLSTDIGTSLIRKKKIKSKWASKIQSNIYAFW